MIPKFKRAREDMTTRELARCINEFMREVETALCLIGEENLTLQLQKKIESKGDEKNG